MTTKTPLTRRTALALTALGTLFSMRAVAAPQRTAVERLADRFAQDLAEGRALGFHISPAPGWWTMTPEERAQVTLDMLDSVDRSVPKSFPPRANRPPRPVRETVDEMMARYPRAMEALGPE